MTTIEDETGKLWEVLKGDPAHSLITSLKGKGYKRIVLPVSTLRTGELPSKGPELAPLASLYRTLEGNNTDNPGLLRDVKAAFLLTAALKDCVAPSPVI